MQPFQQGFTAPTWQHVLVLLVGAILTPGRRTVAAALRVTGHAQVRCRYGATAEDHLEKLQYDLYYIKSYSVMFDLSIILDTIKVVLLRIGAR